MNSTPAKVTNKKSLQGCN